MTLTVNGETVVVPEICTVVDLLDRYGLGRATCAVEVNAEVVPRAAHTRRRLAEGDRVEVVTLVGGG